jgi:hypothetical protein
MTCLRDDSADCLMLPAEACSSPAVAEDPGRLAAALLAVLRYQPVDVFTDFHVREWDMRSGFSHSSKFEKMTKRWYCTWGFASVSTYNLSKGERTVLTYGSD